MGGASSSTARNKSVQQITNSIVQTSAASCGVSCQQLQQGNTVIIENSTVGDITFLQQCTVDADCMIQNSLDASATAIQQAIQNGTAQPSWYLGASITSSKNSTEQDIKNSIQQSINSTCKLDVSQQQTGNFVYARNSQTGNIGFIQTSNEKFNCAIQNMGKGTAAATQSADQTAQSGGITSIGILVIGIISIGFLSIIIFFILRRRQKKAFNAKKKELRQFQGSTTREAAGAFTKGLIGVDPFVRRKPRLGRPVITPISGGRAVIKFNDGSQIVVDEAKFRRALRTTAEVSGLVTQQAIITAAEVAANVAIGVGTAGIGLSVSVPTSVAISAGTATAGAGVTLGTTAASSATSGRKRKAERFAREQASLQ